MKDERRETRDEDFSDLEIKPAAKHETDVEKINNGKLKIIMERVTSMGKIDAKETTEMLVALGKITTSVKESIDDDGKITLGDLTKFTDDLFPLIAGIKDANKIPEEFKDGYDELEKANMKLELGNVLELGDNDAAAVDAGLDVIFALNKFFLVAGIIK